MNADKRGFLIRVYPRSSAASFEWIAFWWLFVIVDRPDRRFKLCDTFDKVIEFADSLLRS